MTGVVTESKSGRQAILAGRVIDATGDADLAERAGAPCRKTPRDAMMGVSAVFSCSGVDKRRFLDYVAQTSPTYGDWGRCWQTETSGKEDHLFSPYLQEPFELARRDGLIPEDLNSIGGTWGRLTDEGEATYLNMVLMKGYDCTDVRDLTRAEIEGRRQAMLAIEALRRYAPGFGTPACARSRCPWGRATRARSWAVTTSPVTTSAARRASRTPWVPAPSPGRLQPARPADHGRYFQVPYGSSCRARSTTCWSPGAAWPATGPHSPTRAG